MYEISYNGAYAEEATELAALETARRLIEADVGPVGTWIEEHDDVVNVWFIRAVIRGASTGAMATVAGPKPSSGREAMFAKHMPPSTYTSSFRRGGLRRLHDAPSAYYATFTGSSPADVFSRALRWLNDYEGDVTVRDLSWVPDKASTEMQLRIYYHLTR